ncbi:hypothetical protein QOM21_06330 [Streptomyces sp. Pv4-95]|uniref:hypothetical protein n=1 Tax=Streptomyces sp. Pv4-95 TaxID=3049543 RepID=UPI003892A64D
MLPDDSPAPPHHLPAEFVRYAVALEETELAWGYLHGRLTPEDTVRLAFLRTCDLRPSAAGFTRIHRQGPDASALGAVCRELLDGDAGQVDAAGRVWDHLAAAWRAARPELGGATPDADQLDLGRREFLLDRAAAGRGMNWRNSSALLGTDRPEEVDAAFERDEELVGVAVIGLALTHPDATAILPRVARTLERARDTADSGLRHQGIVALAHTARLHGTVDARCLDLLRGCPRGNEADTDIWAYVAHRRLPLWMWRYGVGERVRWLLCDRWRG